MSKYCKKCEKELPQNSKKNFCKNCQNKMNVAIRKIGEGAFALVVLVGSTALAVITKGKFGGPKA